MSLLDDIRARLTIYKESPMSASTMSMIIDIDYLLSEIAVRDAIIAKQKAELEATEKLVGILLRPKDFPLL